MWVIVILGLIQGYLLSRIINRFSSRIVLPQKYNDSYWKAILIVIITVIFFILSYSSFGNEIKLIYALILDSILIVVTFLDLRHRIIPNKIVIATFFLGVLFLISGSITVMDGLLGMAAGGGMLAMLSLVPGAMGGGDIKLMFALGIFLGLRGTLASLTIAFILASFISILLLIFKIIGRKDHIPFGPFLAIGSFIAFNFIT